MTGRKPSLGFIGAGRVGTALARALAAAGYSVVAVASRTQAAADALARSIPGALSCATNQEVADSADLVFLTMPDREIRPVAESLRWRSGTSIVHTSGAETRAVLAAAAAQGAFTGSLHPLQTFADFDQARSKVRGSAFGVEAEEPLKGVLLEIVADLGGTAVELRAEDKVLYHASAVLISNYTVTLARLASELWQSFGWERAEALKALGPLLIGTVANLERLGLPDAITGPVARGDVETVARHLGALATAAPATLPAYRELARQAIPLGLAKGSLADADARRLAALLACRSSTAPERMEEQP